MLCLRFYALLLALYPRAFRERYGLELWQTARDLAEEYAAQEGIARAGFWLTIYSDTLIAALAERGHIMRHSTWAAWSAFGMTLLAVIVSVGVSLDLYLFEDDTALVLFSHNFLSNDLVAQLLRYSYDTAYIAALAAGVVGVVAVASTFVPQRIAFWMTIGLAAIVAVGGFGGLIARYPLNGVETVGGFAALIALCLITRWLVARAIGARWSAQVSAGVSACAGALVALIVETVALVTHTFMLHFVTTLSVSVLYGPHDTLITQGTIANGSAAEIINQTIGTSIQAVVVGVCVTLLVLALRQRRSAPSAPSAA